MVQLMTTYDKTLKTKIFVLKGEEAYARTTDVVSDIISDYTDCNTHKNYARVGLMIDVLRSVGDGFINIYDNDDLIFETIPWSTGNMGTVIDSDWNDKGVFWENDKLIIGSDATGMSQTGLFLSYDVPHNIKVKWSGNHRCLGSTEKISFIMEEPKIFESRLSLTTPNSGNRYNSGDEIDNLSLTFTCDGTVINTKDVNIYEGDTLLTDEPISCTKDTPVTVDLGELSDGKHTFKAIFVGDDETSYAETTLDISVGYNILVTDYPSSSLLGVSNTVKCRVLDYFNLPVGSVSCVGVYYDGSDYNIASNSGNTDADGYATLTNFVFDSFGSNKSHKVSCSIDSVNYYSANIPSTLVNPTGISITSSDTITVPSNSISITGSVSYTTNDGTSPNVPVIYTESGGSTTITTTAKSFNKSYLGHGKGDTTVSFTFGSYSQSLNIEDVLQYASVRNNKELTTGFYAGQYATKSKTNDGYIFKPTVTSDEFNNGLRGAFYVDLIGNTPSGYATHVGDVFVCEFVNARVNNTHQFHYGNSQLNMSTNIKIECTVTSVFGNNIQFNSKVYLDGVYVSDYSGMNTLQFVIDQVNLGVVVDNLKIKKVS